MNLTAHRSNELTNNIHFKPDVSLLMFMLTHDVLPHDTVPLVLSEVLAGVFVVMFLTICALGLDLGNHTHINIRNLCVCVSDQSWALSFREKIGYWF